MQGGERGGAHCDEESLSIENQPAGQGSTLRFNLRKTRKYAMRQMSSHLSRFQGIISIRRWAIASIRIPAQSDHILRKPPSFKGQERHIAFSRRDSTACFGAERQIAFSQIQRFSTASTSFIAQRLPCPPSRTRQTTWF